MALVTGRGLPAVEELRPLLGNGKSMDILLFSSSFFFLIIDFGERKAETSVCYVCIH